MYYFLDHFSIELNEICSPSLLNSILKKVQRDISLNIMIFLSNKISFVSPQKLIKNVLFNQTKNTYVSSSTCLLFHYILTSRFKVICTLYERVP